MRVLFLTHRLPYAPNRGDRVRAYHLVRTLAPVVDIEIASLVHDDDEARHTSALEQMGVRVHALRTRGLGGYARAALTLPGSRPVTHALLDSPDLHATLAQIVGERRPDVVLAYCSGMARLAVEPPLAGLPFVLDMVDVDSEKWSTLARTARWPKSWVYRREAACLARFERQVAQRAVTTLVINERERGTLARLAPTAAIEVVHNGVDVAQLRPPSDPLGTPTVVFCGVMNYAPNVEGVAWFASEVWPIVRSRVPDASFIIVGSSPTAAISALASAERHIEVTGAVPDVRTHLWNAAVSVAPLAAARGLQNKVLEALAAGLPTIVTPQVFEGLPGQAQPGCIVATSPTQFADATVTLLGMSAVERRSLAARADLTGFTWEAQLGRVPRLLEHAANGGRQPVGDRIAAARS